MIGLILVFVFLCIIEFIVHVAFLNLSATLHESLDPLMNIFFFPHRLELLFDIFSTRETSEIKISIILHKILRIAQSFQLGQDHFLLMKNSFVILSVLLLFLHPHLQYFPSLHILQLRLFLNKVIISLKPRIEFIITHISFIFIRTLIPGLHIIQSLAKFLLIPYKQSFFCLFVLTYHTSFRHSFHVVLGVN